MTPNRFLKLTEYQDKEWGLKHKPLKNIKLIKYALYRSCRDHRSWPHSKSYGLTRQKDLKHHRDQNFTGA